LSDVDKNYIRLIQEIISWYNEYHLNNVNLGRLLLQNRIPQQKIDDFLKLVQIMPNNNQQIDSREDELTNNQG
jgi:hypothetical protein